MPDGWWVWRWDRWFNMQCTSFKFIDLLFHLIYVTKSLKTIENLNASDTDVISEAIAPVPIQPDVYTLLMKCKDKRFHCWILKHLVWSKVIENHEYLLTKNQTSDNNSSMERKEIWCNYIFSVSLFNVHLSIIIKANSATSSTVSDFRHFNFRLLWRWLNLP